MADHLKIFQARETVLLKHSQTKPFLSFFSPYKNQHKAYLLVAVTHDSRAFEEKEKNLLTFTLIPICIVNSPFCDLYNTLRKKS